MEKSDRAGITEGYPRIRRRFGKLTAWIQLLRPLTLLAPIAAGVFGTLSPVENIGLQEFTLGIYVGLTLALAQASGQAINQAVDAELDKQLDKKRYRPIPSNLISRDAALGFGWLLALFAIGRAFTISSFFGVVTLTLIFFAAFYSMAPFSPRKVNPFLNTGWMAFSRGFLPLFAVWSVFGGFTEALPWAIFSFLWLMAYQPSKDLQDAQVDKQFGIRTIPNTYGMKRLLMYSASVTTVMYIYASFYTEILLLLFPVSVVALLGLEKRVKGLENNLSWVCMYAGLAIMYLLMFLNYHF